MKTISTKSGTACLCLLAGLVLMVFPASSWAGNIGFTNTLKCPVYIEAASVIRGRIVRDRPLLIKSGKVAWHFNVPAGKRVIYVYDANKPSRILFQGSFLVAGQNLFFAVQKTEMGQDNSPKVKVVPALPPKR